MSSPVLRTPPSQQEDLLDVKPASSSSATSTTAPGSSSNYDATTATTGVGDDSAPGSHSTGAGAGGSSPRQDARAAIGVAQGGQGRESPRGAGDEEQVLAREARGPGVAGDTVDDEQERTLDPETETWKATICRHYLCGNCTKGARCRFPHPTAEDVLNRLGIDLSLRTRSPNSGLPAAVPRRQNPKPKNASTGKGAGGSISGSTLGSPVSTAKGAGKKGKKAESRGKDPLGVAGAYASSSSATSSWNRNVDDHYAGTRTSAAPASSTTAPRDWRRGGTAGAGASSVPARPATAEAEERTAALANGVLDERAYAFNEHYQRPEPSQRAYAGAASSSSAASSPSRRVAGGAEAYAYGNTHSSSLSYYDYGAASYAAAARAGQSYSKSSSPGVVPQPAAHAHQFDPIYYGYSSYASAVAAPGYTAGKSAGGKSKGSGKSTGTGYGYNRSGAAAYHNYGKGAAAGYSPSSPYAAAASDYELQQAPGGELQVHRQLRALLTDALPPEIAAAQTTNTYAARQQHAAAVSGGILLGGYNEYDYYTGNDQKYAYAYGGAEAGGGVDGYDDYSAALGQVGQVPLPPDPTSYRSGGGPSQPPGFSPVPSPPRQHSSLGLRDRGSQLSAVDLFSDIQHQLDGLYQNSPAAGSQEQVSLSGSPQHLNSGAYDRNMNNSAAVVSVRASAATAEGPTSPDMISPSSSHMSVNTLGRLMGNSPSNSTEDLTQLNRLLLDLTRLQATLEQSGTELVDPLQPTLAGMTPSTGTVMNNSTFLNYGGGSGGLTLTAAQGSAGPESTSYNNQWHSLSLDREDEQQAPETIPAGGTSAPAPEPPEPLLFSNSAGRQYTTDMYQTGASTPEELCFTHHQTLVSPSSGNSKLARGAGANSLNDDQSCSSPERVSSPEPTGMAAAVAAASIQPPTLVPGDRGNPSRFCRTNQAQDRCGAMQLHYGEIDADFVQNEAGEEGWRDGNRCGNCSIRRYRVEEIENEFTSIKLSDQIMMSTLLSSCIIERAGR